jgi:5-hydroxyisourate hydrolase-like protein (transthyretin family)
MTTRFATATATALLLGATAAGGASAQAIGGRVFDDESGRPVADVAVALYDAAGERLAAARTDSAGAFRLTAPLAGTYTLVFDHAAYAMYRSEPLRLATGERLIIEVQLARTVYAIDPITVTARGRRHDATYDGLYARLPRFPAQVGSNRILVKGDVELTSSRTAREVLDRYFHRVAQRLGGACVYWNGVQDWPAVAAARLETHTDDIEAIEVYGDYLMAPMTMWGPPLRPLATRCGAVIAIWALRPDLPGREPR